MKSLVEMEEAQQHLPGSGGDQRLRLVVADGSPQYFGVVCRVLNFDGVIDLVGRAADYEEAFKLTLGQRADIVLIDLQMPLADLAITAIQLFARPGTKIVGMLDSHPRCFPGHVSLRSIDALVRKQSLETDLSLLLDVLYDGNVKLQSSVPEVDPMVPRFQEEFNQAAN